MAMIDYEGNGDADADTNADEVSSSPWILPEHRRLPLRKLWILKKRHQAWAFRAEQGSVWNLRANVERLESGGFNEGGEDVNKLNQLARPNDDQFW